jgi:hypothetical protein
LAVGTVTTGEPGTDAQVVNSGTPQNAVFDFTIPKGDTGTTPPVSLLSAYSTPSQGLSSGGAMAFDRNALSYGSDISHTNGSSSFTINTPGVYSVSFHGVITPAADTSFPVNLFTSLTNNGTAVPEATIPYNFQSESDSSDQSFNVPLAVSTTPTTLQVVATGASYLADAITMYIHRLGDIPS